MSDIDKPEGTPLEQAIAHLAHETVRLGIDPGRSIAFLLMVLELKRTWWPTLTKAQRRAVLDELRRIREDAEQSLRDAQRRPVRFRHDDRGRVRRATP